MGGAAGSGAGEDAGVSATTEDGRACWVAAVTESDHPWWMPPEDVELYELAAKREADRLVRLKQQEDEAHWSDFEDRLRKAQQVEAGGGKPACLSAREWTAYHAAKGAAAWRKLDLHQAILDGSVTDLDAPVPARRPAELAKVADARGAREARELGQDLTAAGQPVAGAAYAQLGKRP